MPNSNLINIEKVKSILKLDIGQKFFNLSFIFLPSALPISGVCIIFSTFIALLHNKENINLKNKWNLAILLSAFLLIISTLFSYFNSDLNLELVDGNKAIIWIKLFKSFTKIKYPLTPSI